MLLKDIPCKDSQIASTHISADLHAYLCMYCADLCEIGQPGEDGLRAGVGDEGSHGHGMGVDESAAQAACNGSQNVQGCHAVWAVQLFQQHLQPCMVAMSSWSLRAKRWMGLFSCPNRCVLPNASGCRSDTCA